ncbi:MAG: DUF7577 domain-containing protein [Chloroflexota bacterium]|nr:MAG: hypothetical protein DLM70_19665 [Chloroflexota bacterium]
MIRCQACGTENPDTAAYCSKCARKLDPATQQAVAELRATHTATGIRWSAVILTLILLVLIIVLVALFALHVL